MESLTHMANTRRNIVYITQEAKGAGLPTPTRRISGDFRLSYNVSTTGDLLFRSNWVGNGANTLYGTAYYVKL